MLVFLKIHILMVFLEKSKEYQNPDFENFKDVDKANKS